MTIAEGREVLCALEESGDSPPSSCGGAGRDGRLLTLEREADTLERDLERERVTPEDGACSPPGLKLSSVAVAAVLAKEELISPNCCCCCIC
jgi:hypothetical protein